MDYSELYAPAELMTSGCSDIHCLFQNNRGRMVTNGGCQCVRDLSYAICGTDAVRTILILRDRLQKQLTDKPLSTESASALLTSLGYDPMLDGNMLKILRAVEQAHGIVE